MTAKRERLSEEPDQSVNQLPPSKKVTLPALKIGPGGKPVTYHHHDGTLYINGRPAPRRQA